MPLGAPVPAGEATCHVAVAPDGGSLVAELLGRRPRGADDAGCRGPALLAGHRRRRRRPVRIGGRRGRRPPPPPATSTSSPRPARCARPPARSTRTSCPSTTQDPRDAVGHGIRLPSVARPPGGLPARRARSRRPTWGSTSCASGASTARGLRQVQQVVLPHGSGPRHMVWHPSGHLYVVTELSCEVFVLAPDAAGTWRLVGGTPLGAGTLPGDTAAELAASRDGEFLYAGVRGSNTHRDAPRARRGRDARPGRPRRGRRGLAAPPRRRARHAARRRSALGRGRLAHARHAHRRARAGCATAPPRRRRPACCRRVSALRRVRSSRPAS